MEERNSIKVCVTGGSGYIASWLVKKLLEKGYTVHATLRNLDEKIKVDPLKSLPDADTRLVLFQADIYNPSEFEPAIEGCHYVFHLATPLQHNAQSTKVALFFLADEKIKVDPLKSLPHADTRLVLFQADIYNPSEFEPAIEGCHYVFHLATPLQHNAQSTKYKDSTEAAIVGVKRIADSCIRSKTVKRLIYTASVMASSPLKEDGSGFKSSLNESCWTPLNLSFNFSDDFLLAYTKSKTLAEMEALRYNEIGNGKLEVVSLLCGLVGGDNTLLSYLPASVAVILSQITGDPTSYGSLRFLHELLGSIPLAHIDDVREAHIFCIEKESLRGRFLCTSADPTLKDMAIYYKENYPQVKISQKLMRGPDRGSSCESTKLEEMGFECKYDMKKILDDCVACLSRIEALSSN